MFVNVGPYTDRKVHVILCHVDYVKKNFQQQGFDFRHSAL